MIEYDSNGNRTNYDLKRIVKGKLYNIATAEFLCEVRTKCDRDSSYFSEERLYKKTNGEYFLYRNANSAAKIYKDINGITGEVLWEDIFPLSKDQTKKFLEYTGDVELYIKEFGEVEE